MPEPRDTTWGARIRDIVQEDLKLTVKEFKGVLGKYPDAMYAYFEERTAPNLEFLQRLQELSGVSIDWIATGRGPKVGGVDQDKLKDAILSTMKVMVTAQASGHNYPVEHYLAIVLSNYDTAVDSSIDSAKPQDIIKSLQLEASNDQSSDPDTSRKKVP